MVVLWCAGLPWLALGQLVGERFGLFAAVGVGLVGQVVGTVRAESAAWLLEPWGWGVRALLPLLRVHANGVAAPVGDQVRDLAPAPAALLAALLGVALGVVAVLVGPRHRVRVRREESTAGQTAAVPATASGPVVRGRRRLVLAALATLRAPWLWVLPLATLLVVTATRVVWDTAYVHRLVGLLVVPGLACLMGCLAARAQQPALRAVVTRVAPGRWAAALASVLVAVTVPLVVWGAVLSGGHAGALLVVGVTALVAQLMVVLWLATRFGVGAALGVTIVGLVWSLVFGGSQLAEAPMLWLLGPWAYAYAAESGDRMVVAAALSVAVVPVAAYAWVRALRRAAAYA